MLNRIINMSFNWNTFSMEKCARILLFNSSRLPSTLSFLVLLIDITKWQKLFRKNLLNKKPRSRKNRV